MFIDYPIPEVIKLGHKQHLWETSKMLRKKPTFSYKILEGVCDSINLRSIQDRYIITILLGRRCKSCFHYFLLVQKEPFSHFIKNLNFLLPHPDLLKCSFKLGQASERSSVHPRWKLETLGAPEICSSFSRTKLEDIMRTCQLSPRSFPHPSGFWQCFWVGGLSYILWIQF